MIDSNFSLSIDIVVNINSLLVIIAGHRFEILIGRLRCKS